MMRIANIVTGFLKTLSGLIVFVSAASWAGALPSAKFGGNELEAVTSVNDYVYYELNLGTDVFDCNGTIPVYAPQLESRRNSGYGFFVIRAEKAVISESCSFKQADRQVGNEVKHSAVFDVLIIASETGSEIADGAHPLTADIGDCLLQDPSGDRWIGRDDGGDSFRHKRSDELYDKFFKGTTKCLPTGFSNTKVLDICSSNGTGTAEFSATFSGECSWTTEAYYKGSASKRDSGNITFRKSDTKVFSADTRNGDLRAFRITVGEKSRTFGVSEIYGLDLAITRADGGSTAKTAGKKEAYRVGFNDAAGNGCPDGKFELTGMKAGLLRSSDNEKSGVKAQVNGKEIGFVSSADEALPTDIALRGSLLDFDYRDFGRTTLLVSGTLDGSETGTGDSGSVTGKLQLRGSAEISNYPQGICVRYSPENSKKLCSGGCELIRSGEEFLLDILPVAYSGNDGNPLACSDPDAKSRVLPSFRMKDIPIERTISREKAGDTPDPAENRDLPAAVETMQGSDDTAVSGKFDYGSGGSLLPDGIRLRARIGSAGVFRAHIPSIEFAQDLRSAESYSEELDWIYPYAYRIRWADDPSPEAFAKSMSFCRKADSASSKYPWFTYAGQPFRLRNARIEAVNMQGGLIRNYDSSIFSHATDVPRLMPFVREGTGFVRSAETIERLPETDAAAPGWQGWTDGSLYTLDASSKPVMSHDYYFRLLKDGLKAPLTLYAGVGMESISGTGRSVVCGLDGNGERFSASAPSADGTEGTGTESDVSAPDEFCAFGGKRDYSSMNFLTGRLRAVSGRTGSAGAAYIPFVAEYVSGFDEGGSPVWTQNYPDSCTVLSFGRDAESPFSFSERIVSESSVKDTAAVSPVRKSGTEHDASDAYTVTPQGGLPFSLNFSGTYRGKIENSESADPESSVFARMRNGTAVLRLILNGNFEDYGARRADFRYVLKRSTIGHLKDTETDSFDLKSAESPVWLGDTVIGSVIFGGRVVSPRMIYLQDGN